MLLILCNADRTEDYVVKVTDVGISPNPVVPGQPATFDIDASTGKFSNMELINCCFFPSISNGFVYMLDLVVAQALSGGIVEIRVLYFGVPVHTETRDICESVSCPISEGNFVLTHNQTLPAFTPPVIYI